MIEKRNIELADYHIIYGDASAAINAYVASGGHSSVHILVDENTKRLCLPKLEIDRHYHLIEIKSGEKNKTIRTCEQIWGELAHDRADRKSLLINLGGGVIGDMGGFAAATYMRGIDFVQVPTTLLSQVDASVGGKLAVDFKGLKNYIGLFKNPEQVIVDPQLLTTLPERQFRSGYTEMIKHALIADADIWRRMLDTPDWTDLDWISEIYQSILIKKNVVENDPTEQGRRKILNFGHTVGHALETASFETDRPLLHGEAIALGIICESYLATELCSLPVDQYEEIKKYITSIYSINFDPIDMVDRIIDVMKSDKKNTRGQIMASLISVIGSCDYDIVLSDDQITDALKQLSL